MLSLLIPVYNFDTRELVKTLIKQSQEAEITFEILLYDDGSEDAFKKKNQQLASLDFVRYEELAENIGRSKIRNLLAHRARHSNLIFFDCDSKINQNDYINRYQKFFDKQMVVYGGRTYQDQAPKNAALQLRWLYGKKREEVSAAKRSKKPYNSFMSNNFYVNKKLFKRVSFLEELSHYGHEDSAFSYQCSKLKIPIKHIDNPLEHIGLETSEEFLSKTKSAIENWVYLIERDLISSETRLFKAYKGLQRSKMETVFYKSYQRTKDRIIKNLTSDKPNLNYFDFYKLGELVSLHKK